MKRGGYATALAAVATLLAAVWVTSTNAVDLMPHFVAPASLGQLPNGQHGHRTHHRHLPGYGPVEHQSTPITFLVVGYLLLGIVAAIFAAFLLTVAVQNRRAGGGRVREAPADPNAFAAFDVPPAILEAAERQLAALRTGTPRNAIVACWMELERTCRESGLPREPAETSTEFTARVLAHYSVADASVTSLAALYREARFSEHHLVEAHRQEALTALERVLADLRRSAAERTRLVSAP